MRIPCFDAFFGRHEFVIRRLHSLTGVVFVGGYLAFHLATNAAVLDGAETYQRRANQIHAVGPTTLFFLEWGLVLLPILFHGLVGLVIVLRGKRNLLNYPYAGNIRYTLQRSDGQGAASVHRDALKRPGSNTTSQAPQHGVYRISSKRRRLPHLTVRSACGCRRPESSFRLDHFESLGYMVPERPMDPYFAEFAVGPRSSSRKHRHSWM